MFQNKLTGKGDFHSAAEYKNKKAHIYNQARTSCIWIIAKI